MVSLGQVAAFAAAALVLIVIPGPGVLFVIGRALAHGRRTALLSVAGHAAGNWVVAVCVALGVGTVVEHSAAVFTAVRLAGAAYLVWLGIQAIRHRRSLVAALEVAGAPRGTWRAEGEGFLVGLANPKAYVLYAAVLPQFANPAAGHVTLQLVILCLVSLPIGLISDGTWGLAASGVRAWFARSPRRLELVGGLGGLAIIGLGVTLAFTGRKD